MPNTMPTLCMDGFVPVNIYDLHRTENRTFPAHTSVLKTIIYKQISTGIKQEGSKSKTGRRMGNKDYESAALTIELRAQTVYLLKFTTHIRLLKRLIVTIFVTIERPCHRFPERKQQTAATF
jgi:hypothetical protein